MRYAFKSMFIADSISHPPNVGDAREPSFTGRSSSFECGAAIRISLHIDDAQRIEEARFRAAGCSVLVAAASMLTKTIEGETTGEAAALGQRPDLLIEQLGAVPAERRQCVSIACAALEAAIAQYSDSVRDTWQGEDALICTCFGVSERTIEQEIKTKGLTTIKEVTRACNAGAGCQSCYPLIEDILSTANYER